VATVAVPSNPASICQSARKVDHGSASRRVKFLMRALPFRDWDSRTAHIYHSSFDAPPAAISTFEPTADAHVHDAYRDSKLTHVGRAGTGLTARTARELWEKLHPLKRVTVPFAAGRPSGYVARNLARWAAPIAAIPRLIIILSPTAAHGRAMGVRSQAGRVSLRPV
jgi:hypothetical protein